MRITKNDNVIVERTDMKFDCLLQGGICGRVSSYPLADIIRYTELNNRDEVEAANLDDIIDSDGGNRVGEVIQNQLGDGRIIRKGHIIH